MSITPPTPPGLTPTPTSFQQFANQKPSQSAFRRPRVWVPPVIMLDAFAAGYAIPWNLGSNPARTFWQFVFPLILTALMCGVAGFYSYRTVRGWQMWSWIASGISAATVLNIWLLPVLVVPVIVFSVFAISTIALILTSIFGAEELRPIHYGATTAVN